MAETVPNETRNQLGDIISTLYQKVSDSETCGKLRPDCDIFFIAKNFNNLNNNTLGLISATDSLLEPLGLGV